MEITQETKTKKEKEEALREIRSAIRLRNREIYRRWISTLGKPVSWLVAAMMYLVDHILMSDPDVPKTPPPSPEKRAKSTPKPKSKPKNSLWCSKHRRYSMIQK